MKNRILFLMLMTSGIFAFTCVTRVYARESREPGDAQKAQLRLENKYHVTDARIDSLRRQKLGYGEINIVLSLAQQMPGGITTQNIDKIMALRQGGGHKEGWGEIAHNLGVKLRPADRNLANIRPAAGEEAREAGEAQAHERESTEIGARSSASFHGDEGFHGGASFGHR